jgi:hypothetical protein
MITTMVAANIFTTRSFFAMNEVGNFKQLYDKQKARQQTLA